MKSLRIQVLLCLPALLLACSGSGDELPPGVIKMVKVYVAMKRRLSVGDKMAGRHGNKGVLSRILPEEDMPYFADGTPVDIILNPLGVPSRMNVGQVLEAHLGWASRELGKQIAEVLDNSEGLDTLKKTLKNAYSTKEFNQFFKDMSDADLVSSAGLLKDGVHMASPVFDGVEEDEIQKCLEKAGLPITGQSILYDGRTGVAFDQAVTVGIMYILKLHHLVDDKIHVIDDRNDSRIGSADIITNLGFVRPIDSNLLEQVKQNQVKTIPTYTKLGRIAAAAAILIAVSLSVFYINNRPQRKQYD